MIQTLPYGINEYVIISVDEKFATAGDFANGRVVD